MATAKNSRLDRGDVKSMIIPTQMGSDTIRLLPHQQKRKLNIRQLNLWWKNNLLLKEI